MAGSLMDVFVKIGADTSGLESGISKAKGLAGGLGNAIGTGLKVAGAAIGAATTAVVGFAASSVEVGKTFDASMSQVAATMGVSKAEIADLEEFAKEMGRTTAFSATQAAEALNYMALAGYDADTSMEMLPNVLNLAAAGNMDLARASDMVTDAQTALGLSLEQTTELVDMMALTSSKTNTSVEQLGDAILTIGGTAKIMAGGTTELNKMLGVLADNGIKGSEAGTKLRNVLLSLSAPTDKAAEKLEALHVSAIDETTGDLRALDDIMLDLNDALEGMGSAEKAEVINTIFNKQDIAAVNALLDTSADRYDELAVEIQGAWIASKNFTNGFKGTHLQAYQERLAAVGVSVEDFEKLLKKSGGNAGAFVEELSAISGLEVNEVLQAMGTNLNMLQTEFNNVEGSAKQMAQTQLDNLAGDITLWKSALEGVQLLISGALAPELREFVKFGTDGLTKISDAFEQGGLSGAMEAFRGVLSDGIAMVTEKIPDFINAGMELLSAIGQGFSENTGVILDAVIEVINNLMQAMLEATENGGKDSFVIGFFETLSNAFLENAPQLMEMGFQILQNIITGLAESLPEIIPTAIEMILTLITGLLDNIDLLVDSAIALVTGLAEGLINALPVLLEKAPVIIESLVEALIVNLPKLLIASGEIMSKLVVGIIQNLPLMLEAGMKIITSLQTGIARLYVKLLDAGKQAVNKVKEGIKSIDPAQWGKDMIDSFVSGIKDRIAKVGEAAREIASTVKSYLGFSEPEEGPLSNFHTFAPDMMQLFAKGIKDNEDVVRDQISKSFDFMSNVGIPSMAVNSDSNSEIVRLLQDIATNRNVTVVLEGDADRLFRVVQRESVRNKQITGQESFA
jgi:TP901 family phage tail tape measure protein